MVAASCSADEEPISRPRVLESERNQVVIGGGEKKEKKRGEIPSIDRSLTLSYDLIRSK